MLNLLHTSPPVSGLAPNMRISISSALLMASFYIYLKVSRGMTPPGFTTIIVSLFFFAGVQLFTLGLLGEYIWRIFEEVKGRPLYIIGQTSRNQKSVELADSQHDADISRA